MDQFNNRQIKDNSNYLDSNYHNSYDLERTIDRFTFQQIEIFLQQQVILIKIV